MPRLHSADHRLQDTQLFSPHQSAVKPEALMIGSHFLAEAA